MRCELRSVVTVVGLFSGCSVAQSGTLSVGEGGRTSSDIPTIAGATTIPQVTGGLGAEGGGGAANGGEPAVGVGGTSNGGASAGGGELGGGASGGSVVASGGVFAGAAGGGAQAGAGQSGGVGGTEPSDCGNGIVEGDEECDDENQSPDDFCVECSVVCPEGFKKWGLGLHCYRRESSQLDFWGARGVCQSKGGDLVSIASTSENEFVAALVENEDAWIGAYEPLSVHEPGKPAGDYTDYQWTDGEPFDFVNFAAGNPDRHDECTNWDCYEHCGEMWSNGEWNDARCGQLQSFVCEIRPAGLPSP